MDTTAAPRAPEDLLPADEPVRFVTEDGADSPAESRYPRPSVDRLREAYRRMVLGRRYDVQVNALTKQGKLAVFPSALGQEACQIAAALALGEDDWLFPTYRDGMALVARGLDPAEVLVMLRGTWHCGYDPRATHTAPQCAPLATQIPQAVGMADALRRTGGNRVVMAFIGDGGTSEGDFHEGLNFAAVFRAPVVFLVQNNGYAISVPLAKQSAAPSLAHKGVGYGIPSERVDGNDLVAVLAVLDHAVARARSGAGPFLVEARTYRMEAHTSADDATRYRDQAEVDRWRAADPVERLERYLSGTGALSDADIAADRAAAEEFATGLRERMSTEPTVEPIEMFQHVYARPTRQLMAQRAALSAELDEREAAR
ncbi:MAG TPA: pyruvate dehydrogenase (acetyl-transferring) E1 component subunit alpha [Pseudonocardiaceae bacterium]